MYTHTHTANTPPCVHTDTHCEWRRAPDSDQREPRPLICLSRVIHHRITLALILRSFKSLQTTSCTSASHTPTETCTSTHSYTHTHATHSSQRTHPSLLLLPLHTQGVRQIEHCLCCNGITATRKALPRTTPALLDCWDERVKACQARRLTDDISSPVKTS